MTVSRIRSPGYPSSDLPQSIEVIKKIYDKVRKNPVDRETIVKELGYVGITGKSLRVLSNLTHYGLIDKVKNSQLRVSDIAVSILHPKEDSEYLSAVESAAFTPELFRKINSEYTDGHIIDSQLKNFLKRLEFSEAALDPAVKSYRGTMAFLESAKKEHEEASSETLDDKIEHHLDINNSAINAENKEIEPLVNTYAAKVTPLSGERVIFSEELSEDNYVKLALKGEINEILVDALDDYVKRLRKRLTPINN